MLNNISSSVFTQSNAIELQPVVSAEWNQNLFNAPYITVAGDGTKIAVTLSDVDKVSSVTGDLAKPNFVTKSTPLVSGNQHIQYNISNSANISAFKIITYVKTNIANPVMVNSYAKGSATQYGSANAEVNSFGWTKIVTYLGASSASDYIENFSYYLSINSFNSDTSDAIIYFTVPEVYATTYFDYQYHPYWPTESAFTFFRPGESYVPTGLSLFSFPDNYRKINTQVIKGYSTTTYSPISPIMQNPQHTFAKQLVPVLKNSLPNDMAPYKYFVSDTSSRSISARYDSNVNANKIVIKFNTLMATPLVNIYINNSQIANQLTPDVHGMIILYWTGSQWSTSRWASNSMPNITSSGTISLYTGINQITVTQTGKTIKSEFSSLTSQNVIDDLNRMHLIEVSPRLEVDLSGYVKDVSINKSLDSKNNYVPISSINTDDAKIVLSAIPLTVNNSIIPIFSSQSNLSSNILTNMLRKNIKFYVNFIVKSYYQNSLKYSPNTLIPAGIFYSDSWDETDIKDVNIQCFDITRYLQTLPVPDYVANLKSIFDIITNILDLAGFTDYDYDSLYSICNDSTMPLDIAYYYCNSKDTTVMDALANIFLAYQIGAFIDEYGIMKFKSLANILSYSTSSLSLNDSNVIEGGYSISNKAKPGKISLRYQTPKVKQSLALQNAQNADIKKSPSFVYTTSNEVLWQQQSIDSLGFNHLSDNMIETSNTIPLNQSDSLDVFHSYLLNNNGYAAIEDEIVSFEYKEYKISQYTNSNVNVVVSVKNDLELSSEVNRFIKNNTIGLMTSDGSFPKDYDVVVEHTGNITNVRRGLFGTVASDHKLIQSSISEKNLQEGTILHNGALSSDPSSYSEIINSQIADTANPSVQKIQVSADVNKKSLIYPTGVTDSGYGTYSVKFDFSEDNQVISAAGLFFNLTSDSMSDGTYFVELIRYDEYNPSLHALYNPPKYKYLMAIYQRGQVSDTIIAWNDVTGQVQAIIDNMIKVLVPTGTDYVYNTATDQAFTLKVVHYANPDPNYSDDVTGEDTGELISVFLNNVEINNWQVPTGDSTPGKQWTTREINTVTYRRKKISLPSSVTAGSKFGFYVSTLPVEIAGIVYIGEITQTIAVANLREIYATKKPLKEKSVSYWVQDREFLNGLVQGLNIYSKSSNYIMQTNPEVIGINYYDVQYQTPAAVSADINPIQYKWPYYPSDQPQNQQYYQVQNVDQYSIAYSTPINTGFRAKWAVANNSSHLVYLKHDSTAQDTFTVNFSLYTHEIIAPSDPEVLEYISDPSNISEVAQIDSQWIQSKTAANKMLNVINQGFEGFSKDITLQIFGNPVIQVGDVITLSYSLAGINQQKYLVHSVQHSFNQGLKTTIILNSLSKGVSY